ncbi:ankyrin repeat domain-containing protein 49-like [Sarcoptes scabiei]|uniref:GTP-binding protein 6-like protein n=2 Tax=Sarcoptes scabiei TaxID=52283 RepID=A0A132AF62_SARSC|nr:GTP-binding protein 6-like protein [Sarcoptes scabiei]UXI18470.1 ankyrin repeat domain-containing protein 49-like [Sarcoptes scabiei]
MSQRKFSFNIKNNLLALKQNNLFLRSTIHYRNENDNKLDNDDPDDEKSTLLNEVLSYTCLTDLSPKNVFVILPRNRSKKRSFEENELLLDETKALVETIPYWRVSGSAIVSAKSLRSDYIFGKGNLESLKDYCRNQSTNGIVFGVDTLKPSQHYFFRDFLGIEVYDRFSIILKIFRERCRTKEARIQLAMAELNYVQKNLHHLTANDFQNFSLSQSFGGNFDTFYQIKKRVIQERESQLKDKLSKITQSYAVKRKNRASLEIPTVAIVGYTNSGKTSLIKALTNNDEIVPEDRLFATLDVTNHQITLPSKLKALLIDTIGFISDIPLTLVHCFKSTLTEICNADLIVHVVDASHPNRSKQIETVQNTLKEIDVPSKLIETMIEVSNKIDKVPESEIEKFDGLTISATEKINLNELVKKIENRIITNTDRLALKLKVLNGGQEYGWLFKEASVVECVPDQEDPNYALMKILITKSKIGRFRKLFKHEN